MEVGGASSMAGSRQQVDRMDGERYGFTHPRTSRFPVLWLAYPVRSENTVDEHASKQVECAETKSTPHPEPR